MRRCLRLVVRQPGSGFDALALTDIRLIRNAWRTDINGPDRSPIPYLHDRTFLENNFLDFRGLFVIFYVCH
jgi:hypothetical protein